MKWFEKFAYKNCDKIVSVLPGAHLHVKTYGIHEEKITCIPNGIDLEEVAHPEQLDNSVNEKIPFGKFIVGYAGSIGVSNALDSFIEAAVKFNENKEIVFVIFGNGAEKEKLMKKALGCNAILFFEPVKKEQFQSLLNRFDICYIGWKKESLYRFGISANKIFDYLFAAKPIIHSVDAYNDPVNDAKAGISVPPENVDAIVEAVHKIASMSIEQRAELGKNGREYVLAHHTYKALVEKYLQLI